NNEHTTNTTTTTNMAIKQCWCEHTKHKRTKEITQTTHIATTQKVTVTSTWFNARVHYTVLTQHPTQPKQPRSHPT
ncbi:hypothetical protein, partial [Corynebacterium sp. HMSC035E02]|uniref:hypothetical protein n=1 Tax=Corynebacterium sp. HMSC035E02 TaxID=1715114 RepID=UPI001AEF99EF